MPISINLHSQRVEYIITIRYPLGQYTELAINPLQMDLLKKQLKKVIENRKLLRNDLRKNHFYLAIKTTYGIKKVLLNDKLLNDLYDVIKSVTSGRLVA